eukprot:scaffold5340_cov131-Isochrysis_galbana.AAC.2
MGQPTINQCVDGDEDESKGRPPPKRRPHYNVQRPTETSPSDIRHPSTSTSDRCGTDIVHHPPRPSA